MNEEIIVYDVKPLRTAGIILGVGMGGFVDGILFHQIFQLHSMLSNRYFPDTLVNEQLNMVWDGIFHAFTWVMTAIGISLLWKVAKYEKSPLQTKILVGSLGLGWGLFNLIEGIIDHQVIGLHHVVQRATGSMQVAWDMLFLGSGIGFIVFGLYLIKQGKRALAKQLQSRSELESRVAV
jgi:uncharacterized membrane protein